MSQGAQFSDVMPRATFNGVDRTPIELNYSGITSGERQLLIPPGLIRPGQQLYLVLELEPDSPAPSLAVWLKPWFLRPQTQFRSVGYNWPGPAPNQPKMASANNSNITYATSIYQTGVEQGADGKSFGSPPDSATLAGRLDNWLQYDPLWLGAPKQEGAIPGDTVGTETVPEGVTVSTYLDDVWRIQLATERRIALWYPSHGDALAVTSEIEGEVGEIPPVFRFNYKVGVMTAIRQEGIF